MENQRHTNKPNHQQVAPSFVNRQSIVATKPKVNYWMVSTIILFLMFTGTLGALIFIWEPTLKTTATPSSKNQTTTSSSLPLTSPTITPYTSPSPATGNINWQTYSGSVGDIFQYTIEYPTEWKIEGKTAMGDNCLVSPNFDGTEEGIGGGYRIDEGAIICVSYLGMSVPTGPEDDYYQLVCNQEGDIKGKGVSKCSWVKINNTTAFRKENFSENYKSISVNFYEKMASISTKFPAIPQYTELIEQIISTFKFKN